MAGRAERVSSVPDVSIVPDEAFPLRERREGSALSPEVEDEGWRTLHTLSVPSLISGIITISLASVSISEDPSDSDIIMISSVGSFGVLLTAFPLCLWAHSVCRRLPLLPLWWMERKNERQKTRTGV